MPHRLKHRFQKRHGRGFRYMDGESFYGNIQVRTVDFYLPAPDVVKVQTAQEPSAGQAFPPGWFPGRPLLHGGAGNNNSLL